MSTTLIDIKDDDYLEDNQSEIIHDSDLEYICDMDISYDLRIQRLNDINPRDVIEIINKINSMYYVSNNVELKKFIIHICKKSHINSVLKVELCKVLCNKESIHEHYNLLHEIIDKSNENMLPIPCKILAIVFLSRCSDFTDHALTHFKNIINNPFIECEYRYKMILNLDLINQLDVKTYIIPLLLYFVKSTIIYTSLRIMAGQNLLQNYNNDIIESDKNYIFTILYTFASDEELDYNIRADSTDVLLGLGDEHHQNLARQIIGTLGNRGKTIYDDHQNIHNIHIDESTEPILKTLFSKNLNPNSNFFSIKHEITLPIIEQIKSLQNTLDTLTITFNRIEIDRSLYGSVNTSLNSLLCRVHNYITNHTHEKELKKRLIEELIDASGKCSTGYGTRLVNVLSGYDNFNLQTSWEDNIQGKLSGRLNKLVQEIDDDDLRDNILLEMTLNTDKDILCRKNFLDFFRTHISRLKSEIYDEVKEDVNEVDFELFFRKAISQYEGIKCL